VPRVAVERAPVRSTPPDAPTPSARPAETSREGPDPSAIIDWLMKESTQGKQ